MAKSNFIETMNQTAEDSGWDQECFENSVPVTWLALEAMGLVPKVNSKGDAMSFLQERYGAKKVQMQFTHTNFHGMTVWFYLPGKTYRWSYVSGGNYWLVEADTLEGKVLQITKQHAPISGPIEARRFSPYSRRGRAGGTFVAPCTQKAAFQYVDSNRAEAVDTRHVSQLQERINAEKAAVERYQQEVRDWHKQMDDALVEITGITGSDVITQRLHERGWLRLPDSTTLERRERALTSAAQALHEAEVQWERATGDSCHDED